MINSKSTKIKIRRIKGKFINFKNTLQATKVLGRENKKSKILQLLFLWMKILFGNGSLGPGIPIFRLLG